MDGSQFESIMDWLSMCYQVFFSLITYTTLFTMKSFESIMNRSDYELVAYVFSNLLWSENQPQRLITSIYYLVNFEFLKNIYRAVHSFATNDFLQCTFVELAWVYLVMYCCILTINIQMTWVFQ